MSTTDTEEQEQPVHVEKELTDTHTGPHIDDVIGDSRTLKVFSYSVGEGNRTLIGEAWQDKSGHVSGNGIVAVMLFEPEISLRLRQAANKLDVSPLVVLYNRICTTPWYEADFVEGNPNEEK